ncbi:amidohydrolase [Ceraceosorus guamensis]|uniref:Amidohydrolase n=1 Tax=Ceraceosorus guamensis TaxID=1522189 RepID=A0A316WA37_9BASI|nr:amidohydrolase [Ceraceosorus guamensis]PWN45601.1 amidohydrolase [Ceraceosorus guamensis]
MPSCLSSLRSVLVPQRDRSSHVPQEGPSQRPCTQGVAPSLQEEKGGMSIQSHSHSHTGCCDFTPLPVYSAHDGTISAHVQQTDLPEPSDETKELFEDLQAKINALDKELRGLSLKMWDLKEVAWEERKTHDLFIDYFTDLNKRAPNGSPKWKLTPHAHGFETAWRAEFVNAPNGEASKDIPCVGFNSELDALPGIGHACGHNLIAIAGIAASLSVASHLVEKRIAGKVALLGTPAEERDGGKIDLLAKGAYDGMDACLMVHPTPANTVGSFLAVVPVRVDFSGKTAHAGMAPWEGVNALDAAVLAYNNISLLRQQIRPDCRVHGIISGNDWAPNVIPSSSRLTYNVRAPDVATLTPLRERVHKCFEAASLATGCKVDITWGKTYEDTRNSAPLSLAYRALMKSVYNADYSTASVSGSTDFGNVTHALPGCHPTYAIKLENPAGDGNHTIGFANAAKTLEAHERTKEAAAGIATVGAQALIDAQFRKQVKDEFEAWKKDQKK